MYLHKDSVLCSYCSAFISTFFLCESGKSDTEGQFSRRSPLENISLFPMRVFTFAAAGLDRLPIRHRTNGLPCWSHITPSEAQPFPVQRKKAKRPDQRKKSSYPHASYGSCGDGTAKLGRSRALCPLTKHEN